MELHAQRATHKEKLIFAPGTSSLENHSIFTFVFLDFTVTPVILPLEIKKVELTLSLHVATHSAIRTVDHLGESLIRMSKLYEHNIQPGKKSIFEQIRLHRTKATLLLQKVIAPSINTELRRRLKNVPYSLVIDESTDVSTSKYMAACIRYYNHDAREVKTEFLGLVEVPITTGEVLFAELKMFLEANDLLLENMVGIGTDGANNLCGIHNSVFSRLKAIVPNMVLNKCICHSMHLCAEKAVEELPSNLEFMLRESFNWFSNSPKRRFEYAKIFNTINMNEGIKLKNLIQLAPTRWLSRYKSVNRILEQFLELKTHFATVDQKDTTARLLNQMFHDSTLHLYFVFLRPILKELNSINLMFQSEHLDVFKAFFDHFLTWTKINWKRSSCGVEHF